MLEKFRKYKLLIGYLNQFVTSIVGLLLTPIYINYFGITEFSIISLVGLFLTWSFACDAGISIYINKQLASSSDIQIARKNFVDALFVIVTLLLGYIFLFLIFEGPIIRALDQTGLTEQASIMAPLIFIIFVVRLLETFLRQSVFGMMQHQEVYIFGILSQLFRHLAQLTIIFVLKTEFIYFVSQYLVFSVGLCIVYLYRLSVHLGPSSAQATFNMVRAATIVGIFRKSMPFVATGILLPLIISVDKFLVLKTFGAETFAYVSVAATVTSIISVIFAPNQQVHFTYINSSTATDAINKKLQIKSICLMYAITIIALYYIYIANWNFFELWGINQKDAVAANKIFIHIFFTTLSLVTFIFSINYLSSIEKWHRIIIPFITIIYLYIIFSFLQLGSTSIENFYFFFISGILSINVIVLLFIMRNFSLSDSRFMLIMMLPCTIYFIN